MQCKDYDYNKKKIKNNSYFPFALGSGLEQSQV